jgi:hypothetical protein
MAPELMMGDEFNDKCDVFSYGLVLSEVGLLSRQDWRLCFQLLSHRL